MGNEMRISNPASGESADLELWAELLDEEDIAEIRRIKAEEARVAQEG